MGFNLPILEGEGGATESENSEKAATVTDSSENIYVVMAREKI